MVDSSRPDVAEMERRTDAIWVCLIGAMLGPLPFIALIAIFGLEGHKWANWFIGVPIAVSWLPWLVATVRLDRQIRKVKKRNNQLIVDEAR